MHKLAHEHWLAGRIAKSAEVYRSVLAEDPGDATAWYNLGLAQARLKQASAAIFSFKQAIRLNPGDGESWLALGALHHEAGDAKSAGLAHEKLQELNPALAAELEKFIAPR